jgi:hypothetical protein
MLNSSSRKLLVAAGTAAALTVAPGAALLALAQDPHSHAHGQEKADKADKTSKADQGMKTPGDAKLTATLVDNDKNAARGAATIKVTVDGVKIVDPATAGEKPMKGQGHIHFKLDEGPVIATTSTKLSFHELKPGEHRIVVMLAGNDHAPLGAQETLNVLVPEKTYNK